MWKIRTLFFLIVCLGLTSMQAQNKRTVLLEQCDELAYDKQGERSYQILRGNVRFRHDDVLMYCDSAYFYEGGVNSFDAFGNVRVNQASGANMTADSVFYDGETTLMRVRGNVVLTSESSTLKTRFLDYFRNKNYGYYYGGGEVVDSNYNLTSYQGYYYTESKSYLFKDTVVLKHPQYIIYADSLRYSEGIGKATLLGPSLVRGQKYRVNTSKGWIYTNTNEGRLYNRSVIHYEKGKRMTADSIWFDAHSGWVKAFVNAEVQDSVQKMIVRGQYIECDSTAPAYAKVMDHPYAIDYSSGDSLYLKADLLHVCEIDSVRRELRAYHNVWFFNSDMQGKCDSLVYFAQDSMARMYVDPVIWSEVNQLTGEGVIEIYQKDKKVDRIHIPKNALIIADEGDSLFNQLSGKKADAFLEMNRLKRIDLLGDARSIYYSKDNDGLLVGMNKAVGPQMSIFTKRNKLQKILMTPDSEGTMFPPDKVPEDERFLKGFNWRIGERPNTIQEFFQK